jgi:hypothetical protein
MTVLLMWRSDQRYVRLVESCDNKLMLRTSMGERTGQLPFDRTTSDEHSMTGSPFYRIPFVDHVDTFSLRL